MVFPQLKNFCPCLKQVFTNTSNLSASRYQCFCGWRSRRILSTNSSLIFWFVSHLSITFKSIWLQKVMVADSRKVMNCSFILLFWMFVLFQEKKNPWKKQPLLSFLASMTILKQFWHKVLTLLLRMLVICVVLFWHQILPDLEPKQHRYQEFEGRDGFVNTCLKPLTPISLVANREGAEMGIMHN